MQLPPTGVKKCSQCQSPAELDALLCEQCGRVFPMQSASAVERVPQNVVVNAARPAPARRMAVGSVLLLAAAASAFGVHAWYVSSNAHEEAPVQTAQNRQPSAQKQLPSSAPKIAGEGKIPNQTPNPQFFHTSKPGD